MSKMGILYSTLDLLSALIFPLLPILPLGIEAYGLGTGKRKVCRDSKWEIHQGDIMAEGRIDVRDEVVSELGAGAGWRRWRESSKVSKRVGHISRVKEQGSDGTRRRRWVIRPKTW